MTEHSTSDPFIPYGRGGAGNMRRQSSIRDAWFKITSSQSESASPDSKLEPARSSTSTTRRRASSTWSSSTIGERRFGWKRLFRRRSSEEEREEDKIEESE